MLRRRLVLGLCLLLAGPAVVGSAGYVFEAERQPPARAGGVTAGTPNRILVAANGRYAVSCALSLAWLREVAAGDCRIQPPPP